MSMLAATSSFSLISFTDASLFGVPTHQRILCSTHKKTPIFSVRKPFKRPSSHRTNKEEVLLSASLLPYFLFLFLCFNRMLVFFLSFSFLFCSFRFHSLVFYTLWKLKRRGTSCFYGACQCIFLVIGCFFLLKDLIFWMTIWGVLVVVLDGMDLLLVLVHCVGLYLFGNRVQVGKLIIWGW